MKRGRRQGLGSFISNWNNSELSVPRRLLVAFANYSRRFRLPPQSCCGRPGEPGC
jgi:hypothetical protein